MLKKDFIYVIIVPVGVITVMYVISKYGPDETLKNYTIQGDKIIVHYINGYYEVLDNTQSNLQGINLVLETQLEEFLEEESELYKISYDIDNEINKFNLETIKFALLGDIRDINAKIKSSKEIDKKIEYLKLCKAYFEHKEILNQKIGNFPVITANNVDEYSKALVLSISYQKRNNYRLK